MSEHKETPEHALTEAASPPLHPRRSRNRPAILDIDHNPGASGPRLIAATHGTYQAPALDAQKYRLGQSAAGYVLVNEQDQSKVVIPDGDYLFVIPHDAPDVIVCAKVGSVVGHTSLTRRPDDPQRIPGVYYAGELKFDKGHLRMWTNGSGHYKPPSELHVSNLSATAKRLLPGSAFKEGYARYINFDSNDVSVDGSIDKTNVMSSASTSPGHGVDGTRSPDGIEHPEVAHGSPRPKGGQQHSGQAGLASGAGESVPGPVSSARLRNALENLPHNQSLNMDELRGTKQAILLYERAIARGENGAQALYTVYQRVKRFAQLGVSALNPVRDEMRQYLQDLKSPLLASEKPVPKLKHFIWLGRLGGIQQDYIGAMAKVDADYQTMLWYDPKALLAHELKQRIQAHSYASLNANPQPEDFTGRLLGKAWKLQDQANTFISSHLKRHPSASFDDAAKAFMIQHLGAKAVELEQLRQSNQDSYASFVNSSNGIRLCDINALIPGMSSELKAAYAQELALRGNLAAASDIMRIQVLGQFGGIYSDCDLLPRIRKEVFAGNYAELSKASKPGTRQTLELAETIVILDELSRQGEFSHRSKQPSGSNSDILQKLRAQGHGELVDAMQAAVKGKTWDMLFEPLGAHTLPESVGMRMAIIAGRMSNAEIMALPNSAMLKSVNEILERNYRLIRESGALAPINTRKWKDSAQTRLIGLLEKTLGKDTSRFGSLGKLIYYRYDGLDTNPELKMTIINSGPGAFEEGCANALSRQFGVDPRHDLSMMQLVQQEPLQNTMTEEELKHSWISSVDHEPDTLYRKGQRYARQVVIQVGDNESVAKAATFLNNKNKEISHMIRVSGKGERQGPLPTQLPGSDCRIIVVGHGTRKGAKVLLGGMTAQQLAKILKPVLSGNAPPKKLTLVGCDLQTLQGNAPHGELRSGFVVELLQALKQQKNRIESVTVHAALVQVDVYGQKWTAAVAQGKTTLDWRRPLESLKTILGEKKPISWQRPQDKLVIRMDGDTIRYQIEPAKAALDPAELNRHVPVDSSGKLASGTAGAKVQKSVGAGMRLYSTFVSAKSILSDLQKGPTKETWISAASLGAEGLGEAVEYGLTRVASTGLSPVERFLQRAVSRSSSAVSHAGKWLSRGAAVVGAVVTLPFDIYSAVIHFKSSHHLEGKDKTFAIFNGSMAVASATLGVAMAIGAMISAKLAAVLGPVGLALGGAFIATSQIYSAVRQVEELEKSITLTGWQKFGEGLRGFFGFEPSADLLDKVLESKARQARLDDLDQRYARLLQSEAGKNIAAIVYADPLLNSRTYLQGIQHPDTGGGYYIGSRLGGIPIKTSAATKHVCDEPHPVKAEEHEHEHLYEEQRRTTRYAHDHHEVYVLPTDETFDVSQGVDAVKSPDGSRLRVKAGSQTGQVVVFDLGDGDDTLRGVDGKENTFMLGSGNKAVFGGRHNDILHLNATPRVITPFARRFPEDALSNRRTRDIGAYHYQLDGMGGKDLLMLETRFDGSEYVGYQVDLDSQWISAIGTHGALRGMGRISAIENVVSGVDSGETAHELYGNADSNYLSGKSRDRLLGRGGADVISLTGQAWADGGEGIDTYRVSLSASDRIVIHDSGAWSEGSVIYLQNLSLGDIHSWKINGLDLELSSRDGGVLLIKEVYLSHGGGRQFRGNAAQFITRDGMVLMPKYPKTLDKDSSFAGLTFDATYLQEADVQHGDAAVGVTLDLAARSISRGDGKPVVLDARYRLAGGGSMNNDTLIGTTGNDTLNSGAGRDVLKGNGGADMFVIGAGKEEVLIETLSSPAKSGSAVVLPGGELPGVALKAAGDDLLIEACLSNGAAGATVQRTIRHQGALGAGKRDALFVIDKNGSELHWLFDSKNRQQLQSCFQVAGSKGVQLRSRAAQSNVLVGGQGDDTLIADHAGTLLTGGAGRDTYRIKVSEGTVYLNNQSEDALADTVQWDSGSAWQNGKPSLSRMENSLVIDARPTAPLLKKNPPRLVVVDYFASANAGRFDLSLMHRGAEVASLGHAELKRQAELAPVRGMDGEMARKLHLLIQGANSVNSGEVGVGSRSGSRHDLAVQLAVPA